MGYCDPCPAGFYCPEFGLTVGTSCEKGYYCPGTSGGNSGKTDMGASGSYPTPTFIQIRPTPCPAGKRGCSLDDGSCQGWSSDTQCIACDIGKFCDTPGQISDSGSCDSGFVCGSGIDRPGPYATVTSIDSVTGLWYSGKCISGSKCTAGANEPTSCPATTYTPSTGVQYSECLTCPPGSYCLGGF